MVSEFTSLLVSEPVLYYKKGKEKVKEEIVRKNLVSIGNQIIEDDKMFDLKLSSYERERNLKKYYNIKFGAIEEIPINKFVSIKS